MNPRTSGMVCAIALVLAAGAASSMPNPSQMRAASQQARLAANGRPITENQGVNLANTTNAPAAEAPNPEAIPTASSDAKPTAENSKPAAAHDRWSRLGAIMQRSGARLNATGETSVRPGAESTVTKPARIEAAVQRDASVPSENVAPAVKAERVESGAHTASNAPIPAQMPPAAPIAST